MTYTNKFLISELHRFVKENGRVPTAPEMSKKNGYPSYYAYLTHFKTWNNSLEKAGLKSNQIHHIGTLDGTEICFHCEKRADEIVGFKSWIYPGGIRYCHKHGSNGRGIPDYVLGTLDINSEKGLGRAGEICVVKTLKIRNEFDCNRISCGYKIDLYHDEYKKIDVKTSLLSNNGRSRWQFLLNGKEEVKTYICLGLSLNRKCVEHVWIIPNTNEIKNLTGLSVTNSYKSLLKRKHWEVDSKPYNNTWKNMKLNNCKIMVDKSKDNLNKKETYKKEEIKSSIIIENNNQLKLDKWM